MHKGAKRSLKQTVNQSSCQRIGLHLDEITLVLLSQKMHPILDDELARFSSTSLLDGNTPKAPNRTLKAKDAHALPMLCAPHSLLLQHMLYKL